MEKPVVGAKKEEEVGFPFSFFSAGVEATDGNTPFILYNPSKCKNGG
jgi:hypothetical protein